MSLPKKKSSFKRGFKTWADKKSIELRSSIGLSGNQPLCAFELAKYLSVPILEPSSIEELPKCHFDILTGEGSDCWSAATVPLGNGKNIIIHNPKHSLARQQSNLMHELAHIICEHKIPTNTYGLSGFLRHLNQEQENEADWLGACLQLPRRALLWALKKEMSNEEISNHFNASEAMVKYRIDITGVKKQLTYYKR